MRWEKTYIVDKGTHLVRGDDLAVAEVHAGLVLQGGIEGSNEVAGSNALFMAL